MSNPRDNEKRILETLSNHEEGMFPKKIASISHIDYNTTKGILRKLVRDGRVKLISGSRGLYVSVENEGYGSIFDYNFQNLILTCQLNKFDETPPPKVKNFGRQIRTVLILHGKTKKATMRLSTSHCINISSLLVFIHYFIDEIKIHTNIEVSEEDVLISCIEFNRDYYNLRLDGVNCITLESLLSQYKLYQKKNMVREEFKLKVPISFKILNEMLSHGNLYSSITHKIENQEEKIKSVIKNQGEIIQHLNRLTHYIIDKKGVF